jgi:hypothetical protein
MREERRRRATVRPSDLRNPQLPRADPAQDGPSMRTGGRLWRAWRAGNPRERKRERARETGGGLGIGSRLVVKQYQSVYQDLQNLQNWSASTLIGIVKL